MNIDFLGCHTYLSHNMKHALSLHTAADDCHDSASFTRTFRRTQKAEHQEFQELVVSESWTSFSEGEVEWLEMAGV